jgi:hypothetical protein
LRNNQMLDNDLNLPISNRLRNSAAMMIASAATSAAKTGPRGAPPVAGTVIWPDTRYTVSHCPV